MLESIERDAVGIAWYNQCACAEIDLGTLVDASLIGVADELRREGWGLRMFDVTTDLEIPVYFCVGVHPTRGWLWSAGAHPIAVYALSRALCEMWQLTQGDGRRERLPEGLMGELEIRAAPRAAKPRYRLDFSLEMSRIAARLTSAGLEAFMVDLTKPDIGFPVVRVVVPGLRHAKPRFGAGRLYDVPVALGWTKECRTEDTLIRVYL